MTIILKPHQVELLPAAIQSGLAKTPDEALDQALDTLRCHLPKPAPEAESTAVVARRLASFGKHHGLTLGGGTIKDLLRESRP